MKRLIIESFFILGLVLGFVSTASAGATLYPEPISLNFVDQVPVASKRTIDVPQVPGGPAVTLKLYRSVADARHANNPIYTASDKYSTGKVSEPEFSGKLITEAGEGSYIAVWYNAQGQSVDMERFFFVEGQLDLIDGPFLGDADSSSAYSSAESYCWPSCNYGPSGRARTGYILGGLALGGLTYALVNSDDDNDSSNGSGDGGITSPPDTGSPPDSGGQTFSSGTANMACSPVSDPRRSFNFAVGNIQGPWNLAYKLGNFSINVINANANLNGTHTGNNYSVSGTGIVAGFNTNISISGFFDGQPGGQIIGDVTTGPLSSSDDIVKMRCVGTMFNLQF